MKGEYTCQRPRPFGITQGFPGTGIVPVLVSAGQLSVIRVAIGQELFVGSVEVC